MTFVETHRLYHRRRIILGDGKREIIPGCYHHITGIDEGITIRSRIHDQLVIARCQRVLQYDLQLVDIGSTGGAGRLYRLDRGVTRQDAELAERSSRQTGTPDGLGERDVQRGGCTACVIHGAHRCRNYGRNRKWNRYRQHGDPANIFKRIAVAADINIQLVIPCR